MFESSGRPSCNIETSVTACHSAHQSSASWRRHAPPTAGNMDVSPTIKPEPDVGQEPE